MLHFCLNRVLSVGIDKKEIVLAKSIIAVLFTCIQDQNAKINNHYYKYVLLAKFT